MPYLEGLFQILNKTVCKEISTTMFSRCVYTGNLPIFGPSYNECAVVNSVSIIGRSTHRVAYIKFGSYVGYFDSFRYFYRGSNPARTITYNYNCQQNWQNSRLECNGCNPQPSQPYDNEDDDGPCDSISTRNFDQLMS